MKKQAWNWLNTVVLTIAGGAVAHYGYLLLQEEGMVRGSWRFLIVSLVFMGVMNAMSLWDDSCRDESAAEVPGLAKGQGPKKADAN